VVPKIWLMFHHEGTKSTKGTKASALVLSHAIIGSAIEVHRLMGPGLLESVYEVALCKELWLRAISIERQVSVPVSYKGESLNCEVKLDLLVEKSVIVEVKAVDKLISVHTAQLFNIPPTSGPLAGSSHQLQRQFFERRPPASS